MLFLLAVENNDAVVEVSNEDLLAESISLNAPN